jgi:antitoxin component YwqK of YwqJK toxin-antitoxin module
MNGFRFILIASVATLFLMSFSCKNGKSQLVDTKGSDTLPDVLKVDSLVETSTFVVIDTFKTGEPMKIHFSDTKNPEKVYEKQYYQSGKLFIEGPLTKDLRSGKWIAYYESGKIWSIGYFEEDLKHGSSEVYYENGKVRYTKNYQKDVAEGLWSFFDEQGNLIGEVMYEKGKILWQKGTPDK